MPPTNEGTAKSTTKMAAATQNTTVNIGSALRIRRKKEPCCERCIRCSCPLSCCEWYICCSLPHPPFYATDVSYPCQGKRHHPNYVFLERSLREVDELRRIPLQTCSQTLRSMAVDGLTGQAEDGRGPPAHVYTVRVSVLGRHGLVFLSS